MNFIEKTIGPIAHEQDPVKIRRAFELGCSGVIVDGVVPEAVTAEIDCLDVADLHAKLLRLAFKDGYAQNLTWYEYIPAVLNETQRWLDAGAKWAVSSGLAAPFNHVAGVAAMSVWLNDGLDTKWHTDRSRSEKWFDVHFHVHGNGIFVADPVVPQIVRVACDEALHMLVRDEEGVDADAELTGKGFGLITLVPGQALVFSKHCLHRSAAASPGTKKLRGAMF